MRISKIVRLGRENKFAVFVDDKLELVLSAEVILDSGLDQNQEIGLKELNEIKNIDTKHKFMNMALRYVSKRLKTEAETKAYLKRKGADQLTRKTVIARLKELDLINDDHYVRSYIHDHVFLSPQSIRKIKYELQKKKIALDIIERSLSNSQISDLDALKKIIDQKRRLPKYQDNLKLMQYLVRIGFNYQDVKEALRINNLD